MQQPRWRKILSYLFEWHVESTYSEHNPHLYVSLKKGRYQLSTANAVYSYGDLYDNFVRAFRRIDLEELPIQKVLILGLGLGSIPYMLEKIFGRDYQYTAVEIDEAVLYLASKYVFPELQSNVETICADAYAYVMQSREKFDLICMDIFLDDTIPENFESMDFLLRLGDLLNDNGILLYNRLAANPEDIEATRDFHRSHFLPAYPTGTCLDVGGNWILINDEKFLR